MVKSKKKDIIEESSGSRIDQIVKAYEKISKGEGQIMVLDEDSAVNDIPVIPSGIFSLDRIMGVGGYPQGRIIEIMGPESSGKTTVCLQAIASAQQNGGLCAFVDAEHSLDTIYAGKLGVNVKELMLMQPESGEAALNGVLRLSGLLGSGDIIVIDSVAALTPQAEIDGEMGDNRVGLQARLMSQAMRKLAGVVSRRGVTLLFINQIRQKIGITYGSNETTPGGNALKFYASMRLDIRKIGQIKDKEDVVGSRTRIKIIKNKVAPPFRQVEVDLMFGQGIPKEYDLIDIAVLEGLVNKAGAWYQINGESIGQGKENTVKYLRDNPEVLSKLENDLRKIFIGG